MKVNKLRYNIWKRAANHHGRCLDEAHIKGSNDKWLQVCYLDWIQIQNNKIEIHCLAFFKNMVLQYYTLQFINKIMLMAIIGYTMELAFWFSVLEKKEFSSMGGGGGGGGGEIEGRKKKNIYHERERDR
ncbi:hypothetical protein ACJX0J_005882 [Zea mays]